MLQFSLCHVWDVIAHNQERRKPLPFHHHCCWELRFFLKSKISWGQHSSQGPWVDGLTCHAAPTSAPSAQGWAPEKEAGEWEGHQAQQQFGVWESWEKWDENVLVMFQFHLAAQFHKTKRNSLSHLRWDLEPCTQEALQTFSRASLNLEE